VKQARSLAFSAHRAEALEILDRRLKERPTDSDARVPYGLILSWEGRYEEARADLQRVLADHPGHGDALPALINVELWSDHPERAEALAREGLRGRPNDTSLLIARVRGLRKLNQNQEAIYTLNRLLEIDPRNKEALEVRRGMQEISQQWEPAWDSLMSGLTTDVLPGARRRSACDGALHLLSLKTLTESIVRITVTF